MIYKELDLKIDTDYLLEIFEDHKDTKLSQYKIKNTQGKILGTRDYFEMYFTFKEGKDLFFKQFPFVCRGYQYVYMPPEYEMVIHKDISYLTYRIGCKLLGTAEILFYDEDHKTIIDRHDYNKPIITNVQIPHNVKNNNSYRLTFFVNFTKEHENAYKYLI